jgi:hypothetical protein
MLFLLGLERAAGRRRSHMGHGTEHHLEEAEHAKHAAHDPLQMRVALSMAIIAAFLAGAALLSHRGHTETLKLTTEANIHHTESNVYHTLASDKWAFFQAKNIRKHEYDAFLAMTSFLAIASGKDDNLKKARDSWKRKIDDYNGKGAKEENLKTIQDEARELEHKAHAEEKKAEDFEHASDHLHHAVNFLDYGHLALELGLVLCSICLLTKMKSFWFTGVGVAVIGGVLAVIGVLGMLESGHF